MNQKSARKTKVERQNSKHAEKERDKQKAEKQRSKSGQAE